MSEEKNKSSGRTRRRPRVWQRFLLVFVLLGALLLASTLFMDWSRHDSEADPAEDDLWADAVVGYVIADEGEKTATLYSVGRSPLCELGRGTELLVESWTPEQAEDGTPYYHVNADGQTGYMLPANVKAQATDLVTETTVYVSSPVELLSDLTDCRPAGLADTGSVLRIIDYDYLLPSGEVNMYLVTTGETTGWIRSCYVCEDFMQATETWNDDADSYSLHVDRGDSYGGGDAAELDYKPHEKGDFTAEGNAMPQSVYALYLPSFYYTIENIDYYLDYAAGTEINTFVLTIQDEGYIAYNSEFLEQEGLLEYYYVNNTNAAYKAAIDKILDAGYYLVGRISTFSDSSLASARPEWCIAKADGSTLYINGSYWPSPFCRDVWYVKTALAAEAADTFGFNEIQFDYVRFPDALYYYDEESLDCKNLCGESRAQAVQRFLTYASDVLHQHNVYVAADVFGEVSNTYVTAYGQYWPAISNVVDVICGMPYPDHYDSYTTGGVYYSPYKHPYETLSDWAYKVNRRQTECSTPAVVRTWLQVWNDNDYTYDSAAVTREILGLFDNDITGGYMTWNSLGDTEMYERIYGCFTLDYYAAWEEKPDGMLLSEYMGIDTSDEQTTE